MKKFLMRKMMEHKLKGVPKEQQEMILSAIEKNPDFFKNIEKEIKQKVSEGKDQTAATFEVMRKHQGELQKMMSGR